MLLFKKKMQDPIDGQPSPQPHPSTKGLRGPEETACNISAPAEKFSLEGSRALVRQTQGWISAYLPTTGVCPWASYILSSSLSLFVCKK